MGLGLLDIDTVLTGDKALTHVTGKTVADGVPCSGYEMHIGKTTGPDTDRPMVRLPMAAAMAQPPPMAASRAPICTACSWRPRNAGPG
jgi:cobyric acid synthase